MNPPRTFRGQALDIICGWIGNNHLEWFLFHERPFLNCMLQVLLIVKQLSTLDLNFLTVMTIINFEPIDVKVAPVLENGIIIVK